MMTDNDITIRPATEQDSALIGLGVAMAIGLDDATHDGHSVAKVLGEVAARPDSQYSYNNALIAEVDGIPAGVIVAYDGARLHTLREASLQVIRKYHPEVQIADDETDPSEFYIDTLAVLPPYRKRGIGRRLIESVLRKAAAEGHTKAGLLLDYSNHNAERLYHTLGFTYIDDRPFFGQMMKHLQCPLPSQQGL